MHDKYKSKDTYRNEGYFSIKGYFKVCFHYTFSGSDGWLIIFFRMMFPMALISSAFFVTLLATIISTITPSNFLKELRVFPITIVLTIRPAAKPMEEFKMLVFVRGARIIFSSLLLIILTGFKLSHVA